MIIIYTRDRTEIYRRYDMKKSNKIVNDFNIIVARNIVKNSTKKGETPESWQVAWEQKKSYRKFRRQDGTFNKKESWQLI